MFGDDTVLSAPRHRGKEEVVSLRKMFPLPPLLKLAEPKLPPLGETHLVEIILDTQDSPPSPLGKIL